MITARFLVSALLCLALLSPSVAPAREQAPSDDAWHVVREDHGITSFEAARPGQHLPAYRAQGELEGSAWDALAVLDAVDAACAWTSHCAEMRRVRTLSPNDVLVYARMEAPWPVRDRDVAVHVHVSYPSPSEVHVSIRNLELPDVPVHANAVRMPRFVASYRFVARGARTAMQYDLEFDPGGSLPDWLKGLIAKNIAHDTLNDLRDRVRWAQRRAAYRERARVLREMAHGP